MSRRFVVNADDLGVSRGATLGIFRSHLEGVVTSASLSPTGLDYEYAARNVSRECPDLGVGLHFTLSAGKPVSNPNDVPLLVAPDGRFRWEFVSLLRDLKFKRQGDLLDQIEIELEAQIERLLADGITPDHIDSERHVHLIPGVFERVVSAATRHAIPFIRGGRDVSLRFVRAAHVRPVILKGGILKFFLLQNLRRLSMAQLDSNERERIRICDNFASYLYTGELDMVLKDVFTRAPDGITEIMVHPGIPEESRGVKLGNRGLEHYLVQPERKRELDACIEARDYTQNLKLASFKSLA